MCTGNGSVQEVRKILRIYHKLPIIQRKYKILKILVKKLIMIVSYKFTTTSVTVLLSIKFCPVNYHLFTSF